MVDLRGWLLAGAGILAGCGSGGSGGGVIEPRATPVTAAEVQAQVFGPRCALSGCHVGATAPFGLDLSSVDASLTNLVGVDSAELPSLERVDPFDPMDSYMYLKLIDDARILGDPMPAAGSPLNATDLTLVRSWIDQGAM